MEFPQYRKYKGLDIWYKISSMDHFTEIKKVGERYITEEIEAAQHPEKLRIRDMLECLDDRWEIILADAFDEIEVL